ncbi:hypothetical protein BH11PLA1_BH11PLA1_13520 [soil metagenome]
MTTVTQRGVGFAGAGRGMAACAALLLLLAGCASQVPTVELDPPPAAPTGGIFAPGGALLSGFERGGDENVGVGDRVLLGLTIDDGRLAEVAYIMLEVTSELPGTTTVEARLKAADRWVELKLESPLVQVRTRVFDASLTQKSESITSAPAAILGRLNQAFAASVRADLVAAALNVPRHEAWNLIPESQREELLTGVLALTSFAGALGEGRNSALADLLWKVIDKPSLLDVVFHGVSLGIAFGAPTVPVTTDEAPAGSHEGVLELALSGKPVLRAWLVTAPRVRPDALAGGIVRLRARSLQHPERSVEIRLIAARRGDFPPAGALPMEPMTPVQGADAARENVRER